MKTTLPILVGTLLLGLVACESSAAIASAAPSAQAAGSSTAAPAAGEKRTLRQYLAGVASGRLFERQTGGHGFGLVPTRTLDEREVKEKLAGIDLDQRPDGPLVRCPSTTVLELADKDGKKLGSIGYCGPAMRFDAPDGTFGGIH